MSITIQESGMTFGSFSAEQVYRIEKSPLYQRLCKKSVCSVEFVLLRHDKLFFIEAKKTSPNPKGESNFAAFLEEVCEKFLHSLLLYFSLRTGQQPAPDLSQTLQEKPAFPWLEQNIKFILVVKDCKADWAAALRRSLYTTFRDKGYSAYLAALGLQNLDAMLTVLTESSAKDYHLIQ